ncbi:unnamed protein product [Rangifer tarandus platyrhynchus]|uniref:Uncharacterized protein n=2 Tax=Rangifer tarandus platyrhynchus TaxID=3082113 RepID=A0ABN8ZQG3_RANTA|nr:unnamed protein product [Rangifer tarandus platyrhynchus]CAI9711142.1 unnamed protein product [Rangifer tarandus platyrhynchus]
MTWSAYVLYTVPGAPCPVRSRQQPPKTRGSRTVLPGAPAVRGLAAGQPESREAPANGHPRREPRPERMRRFPTMLFYDWKDPLLEACGEGGLHHRHRRPRETPPCGRRANCPVMGRGAGRHRQSCEGRGFSPRAPAESSEQFLLREGRFFFQCGPSTTPPPSVESTRSALSCGCSPEDRRPRVLREERQLTVSS